MSVWVTSLVSTEEVINLMLDKYKVDSKPCNFALFVVRDNGGKIQSYKSWTVTLTIVYKIDRSSPDLADRPILVCCGGWQTVRYLA